MNQPAQNASLALEPLFAAVPHQREIENFYCYAAFEPSVAALRQPHRPHSSMANLRNESVDTKDLTCQPRPLRQFQCTRFEKTFLRQHAVLPKQYFQLIGQSWVLALEGVQPGRALFACHLQRLVKVGTQSLPLIQTELGHLPLD